MITRNFYYSLSESIRKFELRQKELDDEPDPDRKLRLREMWAQQDNAEKIADAIRSQRRGGFF